MCFPNKKQNTNFTDDTEKRDNEKPTKGLNSPTAPSIQSPPTIPPITNNTLNVDMSSPKVAIIIYSMYGHILKRSLGCSSNIICPYSFFRYLVAEAEKAGIESAGGKVDIYQYGSISFSK
jgi:NAD(P)H dehydrogenase (quinone)